MAEDIKTTDVRLLLDSGLLFKINLEILHPLGLAMGMDQNTGAVELWDYRDDPEGMIYSDGAYAHGLEKLEQFVTEFVNKKLEERQSVLGYTIQPDPNAKSDEEKE